VLNKFFSEFVNRHVNKKLLNNFIALFTLQGLNYILPLITLPYLVRVLGVENFGLINFIGATIGYFAIFIGFGFSLSATRQVAMFNKDIYKISNVFSSVIVCQILLSLVSLIFLTLVIIIFFEKFRDYWYVYFLFMSVPIANVFFPVWFFQGMEKMKFITFLNTFSKLTFTVAIFIFIKDKNDFYLVPFFTFFGTFLASIVALLIIFYKFKIRFYIPNKNSLIYQFNESKYIFLSTIVGSSYTISITFILGLLTNNTVVGYFSGADRIIKALQGVFQPVITTLYPHISQLKTQDENQSILLLKKTIKIVLLVSFTISIIIFSFAEQIVDLILGSEYSISVISLKIMSIVPVFVAIGSVISVLIMLSFGRSAELSKIYIKTGTISLIITPTLIYFFQGLGASVSVLLVELLALSLMIVYLKKSDINII
jgi:PST family polysaccharide transporter